MKTEVKHFRIDTTTLEVIDDICNKDKIKFSDYIRNLIEKDFVNRNICNTFEK